MTKKYVDSFDSEEEFIEADLEMVKEQAESKGMELSEWLNILLMKGSKTNTVCFYDQEVCRFFRF